MLGGEPFEQADALTEVLAACAEEGLGAMVYSGHTLATWRRLGGAVAQLLAASDVLVDGPYLPHLADERLAWRGSANQRLLCLSGRYRPEELEEAFARQGKGFSVQVLPGRVSISRVPGEGGGRGGRGGAIGKGPP